MSEFAKFKSGCMMYFGFSGLIIGGFVLMMFIVDYADSFFHLLNAFSSLLLPVALMIIILLVVLGPLIYFSRTSIGRHSHEEKSSSHEYKTPKSRMDKYQ